jgi:hypothetical protein
MTKTVDYDASELMTDIDRLDRGWRDLVNEYGFTPVERLRRQGYDLVLATAFLEDWRNARQIELSRGVLFS